MATKRKLSQQPKPADKRVHQPAEASARVEPPTTAEPAARPIRYLEAVDAAAIREELDRARDALHELHHHAHKTAARSPHDDPKVCLLPIAELNSALWTIDQELAKGKPVPVEGTE